MTLWRHYDSDAIIESDRGIVAEKKRWKFTGNYLKLGYLRIVTQEISIAKTEQEEVYLYPVISITCSPPFCYYINQPSVGMARREQWSAVPIHTKG